MKHLRKFNENIYLSKNNIEELEKFSEQYLAYLFDEGFRLNFSISRGNRQTSIFLVKDLGEEDTFTWPEIKDVFIPYITILNENYNIKNYVNFDLDLGIKFLNFYITIDDIINDEIDTLESDRYGNKISKYTSYYNTLSECDIVNIEIIITNHENPF